MRIFFSEIDKKYLISSLSYDLPVDCMIRISIVGNDDTVKRVELYSMDKNIIELIIDEIYKEVFDYLLIKYYVL